MPSSHSVTGHISKLKSGDEESASELWQRYFDKLVRLARKQLGSHPTRVADEEDVALSSFRCLCEGARRGLFEDLSNREDLWKLLVKITQRKSIDLQRRAKSQKRGGGTVRGESAFRSPAADTDDFGIAEAAVDELSPQNVIALAEEHNRLLEMLDDDTLRTVALFKMEGFTNKEIALRIDRTTRSVERKLQSIREIWSKELEQE